jgi:hypothetical protein
MFKHFLDPIARLARSTTHFNRKSQHPAFLDIDAESKVGEFIDMMDTISAGRFFLGVGEASSNGAEATSMTDGRCVCLRRFGLGLVAPVGSTTNPYFIPLFLKLTKFSFFFELLLPDREALIFSRKFSFLYT